MKPIFLLSPIVLAGACIAAEAPNPPLLNDSNLKVELFASYPEVETPTTVSASPDGAVYVGNDPRDSRLNTLNPECSIVRYSSLGADRKRTVFAQNVYSPAGMLWHDGWLYLVHDPLLTRFKDTDGDGVADVREDLITHLGQEPHEGLNDHVVSGFTLGMDGFFYLSVGDKGVYNAKGKDNSEVSLQGGGIIRCRPDGTQLEVYSGGTRNHLEVNLDAMDRPFTLDNTDDGNGWWTRLEYHVESGYYGYPYFYRNDATNGLLLPGPRDPQPLPNAPAVNERILPSLTDFGGGSPTGGLCYMSDGLPESYRGKQFFSEWGQRRISVIEVARKGAGFEHVKNEPLLESDKSGSFRPMELYVAADGSLLISDWGYGGWKAPKRLGSIWRISWPDAKPAPRLTNAENNPISDLLSALKHPDRDQRLRAEWALIHRGAAAFPAVNELALQKDASEVQRAHALWTLELIGAAIPAKRTESIDTLRKLLTDPNAEIRAQATRALGAHWTKEAVADISPLLKDPDAQVRLQAAIALGRIGDTTASATLVQSLGGEDRWVRFVTRAALIKLRSWTEVAPLLKSSEPLLREQAWLVFTDVSDEMAVDALLHLSTDPDPTLRERAATALAQAAYLPKEWDGHWWSTQPVKNPPPLNSVIWSGTPKATAALAVLLTDPVPSVRHATAKALSYCEGRELLPALRSRLSAEKDANVQRQIIETLGVQKDPETSSVFTGIALNENAGEDFRNAAVIAALNIGGDGTAALIAKLIDRPFAPATVLKLVQAAGTQKVMAAVPTLARHAVGADKPLRIAAMKALAAIGGKATTTEIFVDALKEKDGAIVNAALEGLATLKDKTSLPALLEFSKKSGPRREVVTAVASMADPSAIPFLLRALRENNSGVRRTATSALKKMRAESWPLIEQAIASGDIPTEFQPEIRSAFESGIIGQWKLLGPFENVWGAVHPPEKDTLTAGGTPDFTTKYVNAEGHEVGWRETNSETQDGKVNLGQFFKNEGMVCAYAYAAIEANEESEAKILCGSDDQIAIWINGKKVHDQGASRRLNPENDDVPIHLKKGRNSLLVKIGNLNGPWEFAARIPGLDGSRFVKPTALTPDAAQRAFALATNADGSYLHKGDPARGEKIFRDPSGPLGAVCASCHVVGGQGGEVGPNLSAIAVNYKRPDLITSIHEPSRTIALGFEQFLVTTHAGGIFAGAIRQETNETVTIVGVDAQPHIVKKGDIKERTPVSMSLMPAGLTLGLKPEEFVDLLSYLETLDGK